MKKSLILLILLSVCMMSFSANDPFTKAMNESLKMLEEAKGPEDFLSVANKFERISKKEADKWQPSYYAAYAMTILAAINQDPETKDSNLDIAESFIAKTMAKNHNEAEVLALQGFIHMVRIRVDPAKRGQKYSGRSGASLQKAQAIDPENPRVLYLLAQLSFGTAQFFGSDSAEACQLNEQALEKFYASEGEIYDDPFAPKWGMEMAKEFKEQCDN